MPNNDLDAAYRSTQYVTHLPDQALCLRIEEHSTELDTLLSSHGTTSWAFISAWNPFSVPLSNEDNNYRHLQLIERLSCYQLYPGEGVPDSGTWTPEQSVLVVGISREDAISLGKLFEQNAIVVGKKGEKAELLWLKRFPAPLMVLHIPHSSDTIPTDIRPCLKRDDHALAQEQLSIVDAYTDELFSLSPEDAAIVRFPVSRLVLDPERFENDAEEVMAERGVGVIYTLAPRGGTLREPPGAEERQALLDRFYHPHHRQLTTAVEAGLKIHGQCLVIDCHSFPEHPLPFELCQEPERADICLGTDSYHTPDELVDEARKRFEAKGYSVAIDEPFAGALVPMAYYQKEKAVFALMIELNRRLYMDEQNGAKTDNFSRLQADITEVLQALMAWAIENGT